MQLTFSQFFGKELNKTMTNKGSAMLHSKTNKFSFANLPSNTHFLITNNFFVKIYFQGVRGGGFTGDIGIDDVKLKDCRVYSGQGK